MTRDTTSCHDRYFRSARPVFLGAMCFPAATKDDGLRNHDNGRNKLVERHGDAASANPARITESLELTKRYTLDRRCLVRATRFAR